MNRKTGKRPGKPGRPQGRPYGKAGGGAPRRPASGRRPTPRPAPQDGFQIVERVVKPEPEIGPFRVLIAVHRPRFRGRSQRAAALVGWETTALLNKQDPVGQCAKSPRPPDLLVLSGDFGRQKDLAIFRAVQQYRKQGMRLIGLVDDCATAPEGFPDSIPSRLCDVCLEPPYKAADLRALFVRLYTEMRGEPAPPPLTRADREDEEEEE